MQVKRFTAPDMAQAMRQVRQNLGPDAVILATGRLPGGGVEISAAVESDPAIQLTPESASSQDPIEAVLAEDSESEPQDETGDELGLQDIFHRGKPEESHSRQVAGLVKRVESLNKLLAKHLMRSEAAEYFAERPEVAPLYRHLCQMELSPTLIAQLLDDLAAPEGRGMLARLSIRLKQLIKVSGPPKVVKGRPSIWALVGPTGVGKTTTVAKLAATFQLKHRLDVGMITLDTYRMAAAEQLDTYGRIMDVQTVVAGDAEEAKRAVLQLRGNDVILIDTVGRAPDDRNNLAELEGILKGLPGLKTHLVLACPTRDADQQRIIQSFQRFSPSNLIFTKLDETRVYGPIVNRVVEAGLPVSYLTDGQKVPDDLEEASRDGLARRIMPKRQDLEL